MKIKAVPVERRNRETFFSLISPYLPRLYRFVRHELAYLQAMGDLLPDDLTPEDVVDSVVLRAYREFLKDPTGRNIKGQLIRLAREYIEAEAKRRRSERESSIPKELDIPETPPAEWVTTLGEEIFYFYQPEEDLKLEDVVPDLDVPTPEEETERREMWRCVNSALVKMPRAWRLALLLSQVDELAGAELAEAIGKPEPETQRILEQARNYLRQKLVEAGCSLKADDN
jgi:RNA polymerase sigma factor (sigma-70 family)